MTVRLRAHHLLCLLTYVGKGYSPAFVETYDRLAARLSAGEAIVVVEGPDEICAGWQGDPAAHCRRDSIAWRDMRAAESLSALFGRPIAPGFRLMPDAETLGRMRAAFAAGTIRPACEACEWAALCTGIAATGYPGTRINACL